MAKPPSQAKRPSQKILETLADLAQALQRIEAPSMDATSSIGALRPHLQPEQIGAHLRVPILRRPQTERNRRQLVHHRHGAAVFRQIDRLDVMAAGVAGLDADVLELLGPLGDVDRELVDALFAAGGTDDAAEIVSICVEIDPRVAKEEPVEIAILMR